MEEEDAKAIVQALQKGFDIGFTSSLQAIQSAENIGLARLLSPNDKILSTYCINYMNSAKAKMLEDLLAVLTEPTTTEAGAKEQ